MRGRTVVPDGGCHRPTRTQIPQTVAPTAWGISLKNRLWRDNGAATVRKRHRPPRISDGLTATPV